MLRAVPNSWFSWNFTIFDNTDAIAKIDLAWVREAGELQIHKESYKVYRERMFKGDFILQGDNVILARAEKPSAFIRSFRVAYNNKQYILEAESAFQRKFVLREGEQIIGSVVPEHAFTRKARIDLPAEIELPVKVFLAWLVIILWKRAADSAAAGS